ncbi:MAG: hypothetical protein AUK31_02180 [Fibrobacteres bacterium CG2_30_45_31]|nr:MAG: hypothetical protein AUK31_02180 [Fibrobacteres bacterium CG2_30_45_31]
MALEYVQYKVQREVQNMITTINLAEDICPVSDFRSDINNMLQKTKTTHRPILLTQHGKSSAVVLDINDYQRLLYEKQLFEDIRIAKEQIKNGQTYTTAEMKSILKKRYSNVER